MNKTIILLAFCLLVSCASSNSSDNNEDVNQDIMDSNATIFKNDFENESNLCWSNRPDASGKWNFKGCGGFINIGDGNTVTIVDKEISHSGKKSMKITFNKNEDYGGAEVGFAETDHIYTRYFDYYGSNFDFPYGMKIHRIRSFNKVSETNNFDSTMLIVGEAQDGGYNYSGVNDAELLTYGANGGPVDWKSAEVPITINRDLWHCIEAEMKLNTPGQSNGETRAWVDGKLVINRVGLNIRGGSDSLINMVLFGGWYSNGAVRENPQLDPVVSSVRYIDDVAISSERIGCSVN